MAINEVAEDLAGELMLRPLLERILQRCAQLMRCDAGSISSVDEARGVYRKEADIGIRCRSGQEFPLSEGMTGEVVRCRGPVWIDRYEKVRGGHISAQERRSLQGVIGAPLQWRRRIIGVCVLFTRDPDRRFGAEDAELLSMFARHAAIALANAQAYESAEGKARAKAAVAERNVLLREVQDELGRGTAALLAVLRKAECAGDDPSVLRAAIAEAHAVAEASAASMRRTLLGLGDSPLEGRSLVQAIRADLDWASSTRAIDARLVVVGTQVTIDPRLAHEALRICQEAIANVVRHASASTLRVGLVYGSEVLSLLIQDDGQGFLPEPAGPPDGVGLRRISERALTVGGSASIDSVPGWGTRVRVRLPYQRFREPTGAGVDVVLLDAYPVTLVGMARLLSWSDPAINVVAECADVVEVCKVLRSPGADVVVLGPSVPGDPAAVVARLRAATDAPVVRLAARDDVESSTAVIGADACLDAAAGGDRLAEAITAVARAQTAPDPGPRIEPRPSQAVVPGWQRLTTREREVRALMEQGLTDKAIAERLVISVKTVEKHVSAVLRKTGYRNRLELVAQRSRSKRRR